MLFSSIVYTQTIEEFFSYIKSSSYNKASIAIKDFDDVLVKNELKRYYNIIYNNNFEDKINDVNTSSNINSLSSNLKLLNDGFIEYLKNGNEIKSITLLNQSYKLALNRSDEILAAESLKLILEIYQRFGSIVDDYSYKYVLHEYKKILYDDYEKRNYLLKSLKLKYHFHRNKDDAVLKFLSKHNQTLEKYSNQSNFLDAKIHIELSTIISNLKNDLTQSEQYLLNAIHKIEITEQGIFEKERLISAKINLAINTFKQKKYKEAITILRQLKITNENYMHKLIKGYKLYWLAESNKQIGNELAASKYLNQYYELALLNDQSNKAQIVSEYETKYQTSEKEKQILVEQEQKKQFKNGVIALAGTLTLGSIIAFLLFKNTKRKQKLAEQEKQLETQKLETVLKEQELVTIDAMIEGQEKERQRIANDLHDDLGGLMATVKLHFNALQDKASPELFNKTNILIEEAYQKVRTVAHAKNSGVIAKQGLLKAVQHMADKVSASNQIQIDVIDHGLDNRLENSLELTLFRIIQELITNIVKHAEATEANIHLTNHEDAINIMVEDNGKGFNPSQITKTNKGMGISSIDKRITHLDGNMTIESEPNKGSTFIIDIPLQNLE